MEVGRGGIKPNTLQLAQSHGTPTKGIFLMHARL